MKADAPLPSHDFLKLEHTSVIWYENITENEKNKGKERYLVITNIGLFILKKTIFSNYKTDKIIPFIRIKNVTRLDNFCRICWANSACYTFNCNNLDVVIDKMINATRISFGDIKFEDIDVKPSELPPEVSSLFLSIALDNNVPSSKKLQELVKSLADDNSKLTLNEDLINSNLIGSLIESVKYTTSLKALIVESAKSNNCTYPGAYRTIYDILSRSSSIDSLIFRSVSFADKKFKPDKDLSVKLKSVLYVNCDIGDCFLSHLNNLSKSETEFDFFACRQCKFSSENIIRSMLETLSVGSFRGLKSCLFSGRVLQYLRGFLNRSAGLAKFEELSLSLSGSDNTDELGFMSAESGVKTLNILDAKFVRKISFAHYAYLVTLNISDSKFYRNDLVAFLLDLSRGEYRINSLSLRNFEIIDKNYAVFYNDIKEISLPKMESLTWDDNYDVDIGSFFAFVKKMPILTYLSINNIFRKNDEKSSSLICGLIKDSKIQKLSMRTSSSRAIKNCNKILDQIFKGDSRITSLDICGQNIQDHGIRSIQAIVMKEEINCIIFDSTNCSDSALLLSCLRTIIKSNIKYCQWPKSDVKYVTRNGNYAEEFEELRKAFIERFGIEDRDMPLMSTSMAPPSSGIQNHVRPNKDRLSELLFEVLGEEGNFDYLQSFYDRIMCS